MPHSDAHPSTRGRDLAFGSVVAGGGFMLLLVSGLAYVLATLVGIDGLIMPASIGMAVGMIWFVVARLARVGRSL
ncbi:MAG: hypothetical protein ACE37F_23800 [Nannocystaceae bacterium]|nr:hypothetical protein [bacterium]